MKHSLLYVLGIGVTVTVLTLVLGGTGVIGKEIVLASAMRGQIVSGDIPQTGMTMKRNVHYAMTGTRHNQETTTDAAGNFSFPQVTERIFFTLVIPHEIVIRQEYSTVVDGEETAFLSFRKDNYKNNGELATINYPSSTRIHEPPAMNIVCDIDKEPGYEGEQRLFGSNCVQRE